MSGPISMFVPATVLVVLAIPLALSLVPPNRFYGVRTAATLADRKTWFRVNRVAGFALVAAGAAALAVYRYSPQLASGRLMPGLLVLVVPVIAALAGTGVYTRRLLRRTSGG